MILLDFSQIMISSIFTDFKMNGEVTEGLVRHIALNSILSYRKKYFKTHGEIVICADSRQNWRKDVFPYYKIRRKKGRDNSFVDWEKVYEYTNLIREELDEFFPYKVLQVDRCEADDIIGVICHHEGKDLGGKPFVIVSSDEDFQQLLVYSNVQQHSHKSKQLIHNNNPVAYLHEHIVRGDSGDDVPNILSDDDTFVVEGKRQKRITKNVLESFKTVEDIRKNPLAWRGYIRNKRLIDLKEVPENLRQDILTLYNKEDEKNRSKIYKYFVSRGLKNLMQDIQGF